MTYSRAHNAYCHYPGDPSLVPRNRDDVVVDRVAVLRLCIQMAAAWLRYRTAPFPHLAPAIVVFAPPE
ncbi:MULTISPECIES: hypothetical protein [unclassified Imperialibacter]|uniref:hypothetical protein n=1 Tax=unclassified Imperialibacter TaxID=2629706 RepID=UPI00125EFD25|nr:MULTISPECIES: hypothetical protein [unclassified Imperialibacter]